MKTKRTIMGWAGAWLALILALGAMCAGPWKSQVKAQTRGREAVLDLPQIWKDAGPQARFRAKRVAQEQAYRALLERIYGLPLNSQTMVYDLILTNDAIRGAVRHMLRGVAEVNEPTYHSDGRVEVDYAVALAVVTQTLRQELERKKLLGVTVSERDLVRLEHQTEPRILVETGAGALPETKGYRRILARRAAELDGYRKLAERILGVEITSESSVRDFVIASDYIKSRVAGHLRGARKQAVTFFDDDSCEVEMRVEVDNIFEICREYQKTGADGIKTEIKDVSERRERLTFSEVGLGAPRPGDWRTEFLQGPAAPDEEKPFRMTERFIERFIGQEIVP